MSTVTSLEIHKSLTQFSSAIFTMESRHDLERLVVALWVELSTLDLQVRYCGINIFNANTCEVDFYGVHEKGLLVGERVPVGCVFLRERKEDFCKDPLTLKEGEARQFSVRMTELLDWLKKLRSMGLPIKGSDPSVEFEMAAVLMVRFRYGTIHLAREASLPFDEKTVDIIQRFAQLLSFGYARYLGLRELEQRNRELRESQAQLVQAGKLVAMGQLVAGVAHEINTPLGTISSNFDVTSRVITKIRQDLEESKDGAATRVLELLGSIDPLMQLNRLACDRIIRIVRDLRNFARLDEAEIKITDLNEDIESTLSLVQHELKNRIKVIKEFSELPPVRCYPSRLNQVFMNLLINACQAIQGKGQIRIVTQCVNQRVKISICDTGVGIKEEHLGRIFDPGYTTKGTGIGTGLGLSISARIIQDHRGTIQVESEEGKGTTFTITLPVNGVE